MYFLEKKTNTPRNRAPIILLALVVIFLVISKLVYPRWNQRAYNFFPSSEPIINPMMGWAPWATIKTSTQPHTLVYADLTWREFEPEQGFFDFDTFEKYNQLDRWRQEGMRVVFRFVADKPGEDYHQDIPDWLYDVIDGDGDVYDTEYGKGFSPNYSNPIIISNHKLAIEALGRRYGQDDFFAYVELGSLGYWGEWHVNSDVRALPEENIRDLYVTHYLTAFPKTHLLMRRPFSIARRFNLGLYNDMIGDLNSTTDWLEWISYGGEYSITREPNALVPMTDGWKKSPVGGEQASTVSDVEFYGEKLSQSLDLLRKSHATFIGPNGPYKIEMGSPLQNGVDQVLRVLGYRIHIGQVQMPHWVIFEENINIQIEFVNSGLAPMYYKWPTNMVLFDENSRVIATYQVDMDVRKIIPGEIYKVSALLPVKTLEGGVYSIGIAIIDPRTKQPAIQFAMENNRTDFIYEFGSFEVIRIIDLIYK